MGLNCFVRLLPLTALLLASSAYAEEISYVITASNAKSNDPPIAAGTTQYTLRDVRTKEVRAADGSLFWDKTVELAKGFTIGVQVTREATLDGIGITIGNPRYPIGISWNWFDVETDGVYKQLKGTARIKVQMKHLGALQEIEVIEFLDDTTLTFTDNMLMRKPAEDTHRILIRKGSVFRVAP